MRRAPRRLTPTEIAALAVSAVLVVSVVMPSPATGISEAQDYLEKIERATDATYHARRLVVYLGDPQSAAVVEIRSAADGRYVRAEAGTDVTRIWRKPRYGLLAGGSAAFEDGTPPDVPMRADEILDKYEITVGAEEPMLGTRVVPLDLVRRMDDRLVERLWVEPSHGIVYRRELLGADGSLVGLSMLLDMEWGDAGRAEPYDGPEASKVVARGPGSAPQRLPYGYELVEGYRFDADARTHDHWLYSDGLHALSVFRTSGSMQRPESFVEADVSDRQVWAGPGPGTWTWEGDDASWVMVAEEPQLDAAALIAPFPSGGRSVWARLGSWWARAWRWITPW